MIVKIKMLFLILLLSSCVSQKQDFAYYIESQQYVSSANSKYNINTNYYWTIKADSVSYNGRPLPIKNCTVNYKRQTIKYRITNATTVSINFRKNYILMYKVNLETKKTTEKTYYLNLRIKEAKL